MMTTASMPAGIVEGVLREHLADPAARLSDIRVEPLSDQGFSGNQLYRVRLCWTGPRAGPGSDTWVLKHWRPGGHGERLLGLSQSLEGLGWEAGLLRPASLPPGIRTPIIGAWRDRDEQSAWIVMADVSEALGRYSRAAPLQAAEAVVRARLVLDRLARLHAWWERPEQQAWLATCPWLVPMERFIWCEAASYAGALGKTPPRGVAPGSDVTDDLRAAVAALLDWLPAGDRSVFERLLYRREPLVAALSPLPRTLLHGDLDDRNIGLALTDRPAGADVEAPTAADLVLIDWEWMSLGTPALDVARVWATFPAVCDHSQPCPDAVFSYELLDDYLARYQAYGGATLDPRAWRRSCGLAMLAHAMSQVSFIGSALRHNVQPVVSVLERQLDVVIEAARSLQFE